MNYTATTAEAVKFNRFLKLTQKAVNALHYLGLQTTGRGWLDELEEMLFDYEEAIEDGLTEDEDE